MHMNTVILFIHVPLGLRVSWSYHLTKLGMKDDVLALAIDRKERSLAKQQARLLTSPIKPATAPAFASSLGSSLDSSPLTKSRKSSIPPPFDPKDITGWANTTGTLVLR